MGLITREDIVFGYQFFLGRNPESEAVIQEKLNIESVAGLINCFTQSSEYLHKNADSINGIASSNEDCSIVKRYSDGKALVDFPWVVPVAAGKELDPIKMGVIKNDSSLTSEVYAIERVISKIIGGKKEKGFLDLGANIGKFLFPFSKMDGWKCYAVEAADDNFEGLIDTCKLNDVSIIILNNIIYEFSGEMFFYANGPYGMCAKSNEDLIHKSLFAGTEPIKLESICLDDWKMTGLVTVENVDFIKMDVEGSEVATIRGARRFLENFNYPAVFCESNKWTLYTQGETPESLRKVFVELGYDQYVIEDDKLYMVSDEYYQLDCNTDYLFVHRNFRKNVEYLPLNQTKESVIEGIIKGLQSSNEAEVIGNYYNLVYRNTNMNNQTIADICRKIRNEKGDNPLWEYALKVVD